MSSCSGLEPQEEILEYLWVHTIENKMKTMSFKNLESQLKDYNICFEETLSELKEKGIVNIENNLIELSNTGREKGKIIIRRHRLAERLLQDVISIPLEGLERAACSFEHILNEDVEENICILLGHPQLCPHNKTIPKGKCCMKKVNKTESAVIALEDIKPGYQGIISYLSTKKYNRLKKLMNFGVLPGTKIIIQRKSPGTIIKIDETLIAIEPDVTSSIYVRNIKKLS